MKRKCGRRMAAKTGTVMGMRKTKYSKNSAIQKNGNAKYSTRNKLGPKNKSENGVIQNKGRGSNIPQTVSFKTGRPLWLLSAPGMNSGVFDVGFLNKFRGSKQDPRKRNKSVSFKTARPLWFF